MIITRSPLRISLGGGGTDLPSYYLEHGGFVISAAINRYVYITLHQTFRPELILKYSKMEAVERVLEACRRHQKAPGIMAGAVADGQAQLQQGFRAMAYSGDLWLYQLALRQGLDALRATPHA